MAKRYNVEPLNRKGEQCAAREPRKESPALWLSGGGNTRTMKRSHGQSHLDSLRRGPAPPAPNDEGPSSQGREESRPLFTALLAALLPRCL